MVTGSDNYAETEFAQRLRRALDASGLTLRAARERLLARGIRISLATLSYWQSGKRIPWGAASFEALAALEEILDVDPGSLSESVTRTRRPGRPATQVTYSAFPDTPPVVDDALRELGLSAGYGLSELSAHAILHVDPDRQATAAVNRQVLRAERDSADRLPAVLILDEPFAEPPLIEAVHGCRIDRRIQLPELGVSIAEVVLSAPLRAGATTIIETRLPVALKEPDIVESFAYLLTTKLRQCAVWIHFDTAEPPADAEAFFLSADGDSRAVAFQLTDTDLHSVVHDAGPGRLYVRWFW